ncbi:MAG TPA: type II toxin-antitoxin system HipA family toxin [Candidatus Rhabdochlamydia sp.]|jgi:serine/threonine-protein kinase HipA|nr:type II toxin-antitoxin system HipA family toxin [Candidatus Rhabdochlamydia sp.]
MTFQNISVVHVYFIRGQEKLAMGKLVLKERRIFFEYTLEFIKTGLELSPLKLPLQPGIILCEDRVFEGLFGVFNDSLPDGWGRLLLDRKLMSLSLNPGDLSPLDRLCYVGKSGMGALVYEPEIEGIKPSYHANLDEIADEVVQFQENDDDLFIDDLLAMNGSSAGARPKIVITIDKEDWIIKFRSSSDPKDIGLIEYAYHLMAKAAHLHVPEAKLFPSKKEPGYFGVKRFDRVDGRRIHMHTISGLLHADYRFPSLDYETIMKATLWLTKDSQEGEKQFRATVFNVLSHNRDDHAKNFSFLMNEKGIWRVSPAYDLTFSSGPSGEHCSMIMKEGKNPTLSHLLKIAEISNIREQKALQIIDEVKMAVAKWSSFAKDLGISSTSFKMIQVALDRVAKTVFS